MMTFHVRYKTGATFTEKMVITDSKWILSVIRRYRQDPMVERVLVEVV